MRASFLPASLLSFVLAACGGGGGQATAPTRTATAPQLASPSPTRTATATQLPSSSPTRTSTVPDPSPTRQATASPTPTLTSARGVLVVPANETVGVVRIAPGGLVVGAAPRMPAQYNVAQPAEVRVETFARDLRVPWALAFAPDRRLFVSERGGRVLNIDEQGTVTTWANIATSARGEGGLMGLALDPQFADEPWVYLCYSIADGTGLQNRISRVREESGHSGIEEILVERFPGATIHDGCRLKFGFDGKLYATTGDAAARSQAQSLASLAGKILRLERDGSIPADNPIATSPIFSYGHRNPQGLALDPLRRVFFATEHGPSGEVGFGAYDEVNVLRAGANYGWPLAVGAPQRGELIDPLLAYPDVAIAPAGATFYTGSRIPQWTGNLFFATLRGAHLQRVVLDAAHEEVLAIERLFADRFGRLRDVIEGPDGALYVSTSNRDGRGSPAADDDKILRIVPAGE